MEEIDAIRQARLARIEGLLAPLTEKYGVTREEVLGRARTGLATQARHELMAALWLSGLPLIEIGRLLGRDHTTVMAGVKRAIGADNYHVEMAARMARPLLRYDIAANELAPLKPRVAS